MEMKDKDHGAVTGAVQAPQAISIVRQAGDGYKSFQVLLAGFRSGLFDWLKQHGPATRPEISGALALRGAHLAGFLQALEDQGILARQDDKYALADGVDQVVCRTSPWYQGNAFESLLAPSCGWSALDRFLSLDWSVQDAATPLLAPRQHPFHGEATRLADYLARHETLHQGRRRVLCFDGGEGQLAVALCKAFPDVLVTAVVPESQLASALTVIAGSGHGARCALLAGSPLMPPEGAYDMIILFHALYPLRRHTNDVLAAVAGRLGQGGVLYCAHWFCLEACDTAPGGLRDLDKAVLTDSHPMCHVETFCQRFDNIGLIDADRADLQGEYGTTKLHAARKSGANKE